jgi:2-polyprenyl-3-methyl-5-hydroxy-6-metoxy-1,4-benzoquinol methylase
MPFDHNDHYHRLLLRQLPKRTGRALDVGCGTGRFARRLAARGYEVDAIDPSAEMITEARRLGGGPDFQQADAGTLDFPPTHYDAITCLASLHHLPFDTVTKLRAALAPGGTLLVLGCYAGISPWDIVAVPANAVARATVHTAERLRGTDVPPPQPPVRQPEMTLPEIRREAAHLLPDSTVRRLLFWRYLLEYRRAA